LNKILITSQGITQLLAGYIACKWENKSNNNLLIDVLVYDTYSPIEVDLDIYNTISYIAKKISINKIYFLSQPDTIGMVGLSFKERVTFIRNKFQDINYDQVYMSRDKFGNGNLYILNLFKFSKIFGYGDSFGLIGYKESYSFTDSLKNIFINPFKIIAKSLLYKFPINSKKIENYILTIPIIYSKNINYKLKIVDREFSIELMYKIANLVCNKRVENIQYDIYLLTNFTGCGWSTRINEVELYEEIIRKNSNKNSNIIIKKHPRSSDNIICALIDKLNIDYNINKNESFNLNLPLEISGIHQLKNSRVFSIFSTCSYSMKFFFQKEVCFPLTDDLVKKYCISKFQKNIILENKNDMIVYNNIEKYIQNNEIKNLLF
jgi:hypothetical protein